MEDILVIGIAGGSGSGKTTLMKNLVSHFGDEVTVLSHDNYYRRHDDLPYEQRCKLNYDEPAALETDLMVQQLRQLKNGQPIDCPVYDFAVHNRSSETRHLVPRRVIIVEGIMIFENQALRDLMDIKIFVDTDADIRLCRRVKRDVTKRGRSLESVLIQYQTTVKPMHELYVEPSRKYADLVIPEGGKNLVALDMIIGRIQKHLNKGDSMNAESLIFDIDGTLWDSREIVAKGYNLQLEAEGLGRLSVTAEQLRPLFGKTMREIADSILSEIPEDRRYDLMERCMETEQKVLEQDPCKIGYPLVKETLTQLARRHRLFIVSNSQQGYPELTMEKLGISHLIQGHLCFGDTGTDKGTTIRTLMQRYDITSAVYIGDTQGDMEATRAAGLPFVWAAFGFGNPEHWDAKIDSFVSLTDLF